MTMAVAVLLVGASVGSMVEGHQNRSMANSIGVNEPIEGVDPVYVQWGSTEFRGEPIDAQYVYAEGENHPVPGGMRELPGPGEAVVSQALVDLLRSPEGELLRPRFPGPIVEILDPSVVPEPDELIAYVGADSDISDNPNALPVYEFGFDGARFVLGPELVVLVLVGAVVLLLPVFIFVAAASRIAGAERDRRLSALRLVGSGARQVRRIAAAESLVSALAGLVLGSAVFLVGRRFAEDITMFDLQVYVSDVVPDPVLVVAIVLLVPALAVLTALFALRRTIIEPLGVMRYAKPIRRRLWWRLVLIVAGVVLLFTQIGLPRASNGWGAAVAAGTAMLLVAVPVLLPWLLERVAGRISGGPSSWQLAIRRLQLDSGTAARVVGGVAVVLAGAIALQTMVMTVENDVGSGPRAPDGRPSVEVSATAAIAEDVMRDVATAPAVEGTHLVRIGDAFPPDFDPRMGETYTVGVMDCAAIIELTPIRDCADGQSWAVDNWGSAAKPGDRLEFRQYERYEGGSEEPAYDTLDTWTVPDDVRPVSLPELSPIYQTLIVTPGALGDTRFPDDNATVHVKVDDLDSDGVERLRNAIAAYGPDVYIFTSGTGADLSTSQQSFIAVRNSLYVGSIVTLLLAGVSLLVLALEQIRERRRPLAVLAASGVPRGVLARSLLWQVALPIVLGVLVAVLVGVGLAWLLVRLSSDPLMIDWVGVGLLSAAATVLALLVTAMTLPFLRSATRLTSLRTE
ncbi:FtsX-like permease family protein [Actinophytocola sp.]|uniref:FtsX-like permease family protein n=1 Tax=Actinophytocola sp. TaxID=1872138 RepID=UPI003D6BD7A9